MYFKNLSLKKYELKHKDNIKGILNDEKKNLDKKRWQWKQCGESYSLIPGIDAKSRLNLLFILSLAPGDFLPCHKKPSLQIQMPGVS